MLGKLSQPVAECNQGYIGVTKRKTHVLGYEMAQIVKVLAYKTDNLSLIPGSQTVDRENQFLKIVL